jgi:repressor LexA
MEENNISNMQLGKELGLSTETIRNWRNGIKVPTVDKLMKLADYFGVSIDALMGKYITTEQMITLPLVGAVNAGSFTIESEDDWQEFRDVSGNALHGRKKSECVLLEVVGESMEPLVHKGEMLVVHRQPYAVNGNIVIAYDSDQGGYTVKRFHQNGDTVILEPANDKFKSYTYTNPDQQQLKIYGICLSAERSLI